MCWLQEVWLWIQVNGRVDLKPIVIIKISLFCLGVSGFTKKVTYVTNVKIVSPYLTCYKQWWVGLLMEQWYIDWC